MRGFIDNKLDKLINKIDLMRKDPEFKIEIESRTKRSVNVHLNDNQILKIFIELVFYSQGANSALVDKLIKDERLTLAFCDYNVNLIAQIKPEEFIDTYWYFVKVIRFKKKIAAIVNCAKCLVEINENHGSFNKLLNICNLPTKIESENDIDRFWRGFNSLQTLLRKIDMPFFKSTTSLLHLLLHLGYDCIKPDRIVMNVSQEIGIVPKSTGNKNLIDVVRYIQRYSIIKGIRPSIIDFYLLIDGGQKWAIQHIISK